MSQKLDPIVSEPVTSSEVCDRMLSFIILFKSLLNHLAEDHGLTPIQIHTLRLISDGQTAMGKIAKAMHCDASNMTGITDRLIALKMVTRHEDEKDRRIKSIQLTSKGKAILSVISAQLPDRLGFDTLSSDELVQINLILNKLANATDPVREA